jgi:hypothetical protein
MRRTEVMRLAFCVAAGLFVSFIAAGCARTIGGSSATIIDNGKCFSADSAEQQQAYFEKVKGHFQQIGRPLNDDEVKQHTASIFIISIPSSADVYEGSNYMGRANTGQLYFMPGKHELVFIKAGKQSRKILDLAEGRNLSIVVKL